MPFSLRVIRALTRALSSHVVHALFFFFNDTATTEIYTLSYTLSYTTLFRSRAPCEARRPSPCFVRRPLLTRFRRTKRSEEHTSELQSHSEISYAVFCLKK